VPDPTDLLAVARLLSSADASQPPGQAQLRRAVSTAYYAVFHKILRTAADRFAGPDREQSGAYVMLYRSFDHGHMKRICEDLQVSTLRDKIKAQLRRDSVSQDTRDFAGNFPALQEARHLADYDPTIQFLPSDVASWIDVAEVAIEAFDRIASDEQADVLALLMVRSKY
jgi:uncharacterized protein (UPF0332 family)